MRLGWNDAVVVGFSGSETGLGFIDYRPLGGWRGLVVSQGDRLQQLRTEGREVTCTAEPGSPSQGGLHRHALGPPLAHQPEIALGVSPPPGRVKQAVRRAAHRKSGFE